MRRSLTICLSTALAGCGVRYEVPEVAPAELSVASAIIAEERASASAPMGELETISLYQRVVGAVEPVAEEVCREQHPELADSMECDFEIGLWPDASAPPNAFQTLDGDRPVIAMTTSFLEVVRNDDELAFVIGHEAGHHISEHLVKKRQQQVAGAILMGVLAGAAYGLAGGGSGYGGSLSYRDQQNIENMMTLGAAGGGAAYSQTYELEADHVGAYIAERAGYDPEAGVRIFARLGADDTHTPPPGSASFWSTHPNSPERIATVRRTVAELQAQRASGAAPALKLAKQPAGLTPPPAF